jgi:Flp pilus assembly protein TadG
MKTTWLKAGDFRRMRGLKMRGRGAQRGSSLIELACFVTVMFVPILFLSVDFGRAYYMNIEVTNAARAGAQYAVSNPSANVTNIQYVATKDALDVSGMTAVAVTGCMCSDGSSPQTPCSTTTPPTCLGTRLVNYVQVNTQVTYTPIFPYPWLPSTIVLKGQALYPTGT